MTDRTLEERDRRWLRTALLVLAVHFSVLLVHPSTAPAQSTAPTGVEFQIETLRRIGARGDNWCMTWAANDDIVVSMDDGNWLQGDTDFSNHLYRITGDADNFERSDVTSYPVFKFLEKGWFGYGVLSVDGDLYSFVSKCPADSWWGPFRGVKLLKQPTGEDHWYRVNPAGQLKRLDPNTNLRNSVSPEEFFFLEHAGREAHGQMAYPFSFCAFAQCGRDNTAALDDYVYIYSPEGSASEKLQLARVKKNQVERRDQWEFFSGWKEDSPTWSRLQDRQPVIVFPEKNKQGEYFGWYSWLPSVVWNPGLKLYIMVNGGTYAGHGLSDSKEDYYHRWMHTKTGSLGFWYAERPWGPWQQFYYKDEWIVDDEQNRTYQPKLSPKWISKDGKTMTLIWSDAMKNEKGHSHTTNYLWNQMKITIK